LHGFHNRAGEAVNDFAVVDMPGIGLNFVSGNIPAFANSVGVTYDIRYRVAGSDVWHTHISGVSAGQSFNFTLPQPGTIHYTEIGLFFGTVPADFALGNTITFTFVAGSAAPNGMLVNHFIVLHGGSNNTGSTPQIPTLRPPVNGNHTLVADSNGNGYIELDDSGTPLGSWQWDDTLDQWGFIDLSDISVPLGFLPQTGIPGSLWIAVAVNLMAIGALSTLIIKKRKNAK